jgi:hypothetical protein
LALPPEQVTVNEAVVLAAAPERTFTEPYAPVNDPTEHATANACPVAPRSAISETIIVQATARARLVRDTFPNRVRTMEKILRLTNEPLRKESN